MADSKAFRRYQAGVERALGLFDASNEWADYIAFLSRLIKALQAAPPNADVPSKAILAKYLAQCLRPSLPAGVHQKALEVYNVIFALLGKDGLSRDLALYLPGISHTLSFASLSTRPWFLTLYDEHILRLNASVLRPALKALILSLLPGIEEENSEDFEKTLATFNRLRAAFAKEESEEIFWQSLFLASITSPNRRTGVLVYLSRFLPKLDRSTQFLVDDKDEKIVYGAYPSTQVVTTPEPGLLIRCFATGLQDQQPLVQRGFLDLLVTNLPLRSETLQHSGSANDLDILVSSAMAIVLRRDMSLNRRLWQWFLGSDEKSGPPEDPKSHGERVEKQDGNDSNAPTASRTASGSAYFTAFGMVSVIRTFEKMLNRDYATPSQRARPFRILISLMDRSTIGGPVVDALFKILLEDLKTYQMNAPSQEAFDEVFRSANVFFDSIDPRVITRHLLRLFKEKSLDLMYFICSNFSLDDDEMAGQHLPAIALVLSRELVATTGDKSVNESSACSHQNQVAELIDIVATGIRDSEGGSQGEGIAMASLPLDLTEKLYQFYNISATQPSRARSLPVDQIRLELFQNICRVIIECIRMPSELMLLRHLTSSYEKLVSKSYLQVVVSAGFPEQLSQWAQEFLDHAPLPFQVIRNVTTLVSSFLFHTHDELPQKSNSMLSMVPVLIKSLWRRLLPSSPQYHVESVEAIWALRSLSSNLFLVDSTILAILSQPHSSSKTQDHPAVSFGVLWTHTKIPPNITQGQETTADTSFAQTEPVAFLKAALLYIIDAAVLDRPSDPWLVWISGLSSTSLHFKTVLEHIQHNQNGPQGITAGLHRLRKLIKIAKGSVSQWKEFTDTRGSLESVLGLAISLVVSEPRNPEWSETSLEIIRLAHDGSQVVLSDSVLVTLSQQISKTENGSPMQSSVLETLQMLVGLSGVEPPPMELLTTLMGGVASPTIDENLDQWITLLCNSIPLYSEAVFFTHLLKLTECFDKRIQAYFRALQAIYEDATEDSQIQMAAQTPIPGNPERSITNLLSGLEYVLARAHTKVTDAARPTSAGAGTQNELSQSRALANNRLTAILCMQDAIKVCGQVWYWRPLTKASALSEPKSFNYLSSRLRARIRRMLEHLINAEPQECLETLMGMWVNAVKSTLHPALVMSLLESLDGARPKFMMPAIFNAIYGRTNPGALDPEQRSSLSTDVTGLELVAFLIDYVDALEDDLLEEIWSDCTSFLRDILANPMPHRQILLRLLQFLSILCRKMENTNFGDQLRMRRELADLCTRLFTAIFTIKPAGFDQTSTAELPNHAERFSSGKGVSILRDVLPAMTPVLGEADRVQSISAGISANITGPLLRSRHFPINMADDSLSLLLTISKAQSAHKTWKRDILEAFNDPKFFRGSPNLAESGWVPIMRQLAVLDKTLLSDLLTRFTAPATAGLMFGVGATAARAEADKQTKINLKRITFFLIANEKDTFMSSLAQILVKTEELLTATPASSPSANARGELFLLLRAISLSFSQNNLVALWPVIDSELRGIFADIANSTEAAFTPYSHLQAAKLLDVLLLTRPEEFQLHEWLYITDTIDAIYPPSNTKTTALADNLMLHAAQELELRSTTSSGTRKPWLCTNMSRFPDHYSALLGSFFGHLSIRAFEDTYSLEPVDYQACTRDVLADLFSEGE